MHYGRKANYHIVWCIKYRRKVVTPEIESHLKEQAQEIAKSKGFTVHLLEIGNMDHVHCFVSASPMICITDIVKYLKGITGRRLFEKYPEIRDQLWNGQLWNHSYYCETIGEISESTIQTYIEKQTKSY